MLHNCSIFLKYNTHWKRLGTAFKNEQLLPTFSEIRNILTSNKIVFIFDGRVDKYFKRRIYSCSRTM